MSGGEKLAELELGRCKLSLKRAVAIRIAEWKKEQIPWILINSSITKKKTVSVDKNEGSFNLKISQWCI